ncbi:TRAP transporter small permease [Alcaligenes endophyticus]|uniref:TRAP transporter small permease protein n=1 Tax=Alcaligenes endophyticus TaxID=1929088 RepID=A0ABT8EF19_9BURK|nr:TRAP transporter small permease [Alcaligenes endophyticus]MCX5590450.1 TRAP transporter small permease [Alcaligenes endophyticus]MDN4119886.1 TRAP transporter small permease [Alcaligenes endophyticus]
MWFLRFLDQGLLRVVSGLAQLLLVSAVGAAFYQVIARFVLQSPADWSEAWSRAALIWTVMLGLCLAFRQGAMLSVDAVRGVLTRRQQRWLDHTVLVLTVLFFGILTWAGIQMGWRVRFQTMPSLGWSISWIYIAIPIGSVLAIVGVIARWLENPEPVVVDDTQL